MSALRDGQAQVAGASLQEVPELDEAFLQAVDRAGLFYKQRDPWRLDQVQRAHEQEVYLAAAFGHDQMDRVPCKGPNDAVGSRAREAL